MLNSRNKLKIIINSYKVKNKKYKIMKKSDIKLKFVENSE